LVAIVTIVAVVDVVAGYLKNPLLGELVPSEAREGGGGFIYSL
jgi:hypothetical protein